MSGDSIWHTNLNVSRLTVLDIASILDPRGIETRRGSMMNIAASERTRQRPDWLPK